MSFTIQNKTKFILKEALCLRPPKHGCGKSALGMNSQEFIFGDYFWEVGCLISRRFHFERQSIPIFIALLEFRVKGSLIRTAPICHCNLNDCYQQYCSSFLEAKRKPIWFVMWVLWLSSRQNWTVEGQNMVASQTCVSKQPSLERWSVMLESFKSNLNN